MTELLWIFSRLQWKDGIDILLVTAICFLVLYLVRATQAVPLLRGILVVTAISGLLSNVFQLRAFSWLLLKALPALLVAIPVIFQPELRRALERLGRVGAVLGSGAGEKDDIEEMIESTVLACRSLTARRHGALIILERETGLQEYADTGVKLEADYSVELLLTIFDPHTPLHDGGVIVRAGRVLAAACVLPLTTAFLADRRMGLRHRAGIGVTESTDAIAIIVSEERGSISIAHNGRIIRRLDADRLSAVLRAFYQAELRGVVPLSLAWFRSHLGRQAQSEKATPKSRDDGVQPTGQQAEQQTAQQNEVDARRMSSKERVA
jgi:diadenylate cyclase